ncbi:MAG: phosphoribosylglycinamide formyltransferase, partial [Candidatus Portiera sp.]|nr:phosphoribosylglycinamide formyltransferase [Portiera sp.]
NKGSAAGIDEATRRGLPTQVIEKNQTLSRAEYDDELLAALTSAKPDLIILAGFMHVLGKKVVDAYQGKMINIHPSLLPKYPGLNTHRQALANGDKQHGLTIHYVTPELDAGPIIMQKSIDLLPGDDEQTLTKRLLPYEHRCLVESVAFLINRLNSATTDQDKTI